MESGAEDGGHVRFAVASDPPRSARLLLRRRLLRRIRLRISGIRRGGRLRLRRQALPRLQLRDQGITTLLCLLPGIGFVLLTVASALHEESSLLPEGAGTRTLRFQTHAHHPRLVSERNAEGYSAPMSFDVTADAYDRFMGRYSLLLSPQLADLAAVRAGQRVLDVGCGPGALTAELVRRLGPAAVSAVDPSESFVAAARGRNAGVNVLQASAEHLPFPDQAFDAALAQLVVHFMSDPVAGLAEMARVTRREGVVAACVWDHAGGHGPLSLFWQAARELDPEVSDESLLAGTREGHLAELFVAAGLREIEGAVLSASLEHPSFEEWWEPFTGGVGPAGSYVAALDAERQAELREHCRALLPVAPFVLTARAWATRGLA